MGKIGRDGSGPKSGSTPEPESLGTSTNEEATSGLNDEDTNAAHALLSFLEMPYWEISEIWNELSDDSRSVWLFSDEKHEESFFDLWRELFTNWSVREWGGESEAFAPLHLASRLEIPGAADALERAASFGSPSDPRPTRELFATLLSGFQRFLVDFRPVSVGELDSSDGFIENTESNRGILKSLEGANIWSISFGDSHMAFPGFIDNGDLSSTTGFLYTELPHTAHSQEFKYGVSLDVAFTCLLCRGAAVNSLEPCVACDGNYMVRKSLWDGTEWDFSGRP